MHSTITRTSVQRHAAELLRTCLRLQDYSPACTAGVLLHVLFTACSRLCSLSAACWSLATAPCRETVRQAALKALRGRDDLLRRLNRALTAEVPRGWRRRPQQVAIDLVVVPYHGQPMLDISEVYRSQARCGTSHFHAYATAYVNYRGQRFSLALAVVQRGEKLQEVLKRLFRRLAALGVSTRLQFLDRGFWSVGVLGYLQRARKPVLMPVVLRGRKPDHADGPSGTRVFATRKRGGWDKYTVTAGDGRVARVSIGVPCRNYNGQWGRHGRQALVYAFWGFEPPSTRWLRQTYRKLFAIETSYRQLHQGRARTGPDAAPYPGSALAGRLRLIAQLLKAGMGARVYYTLQPGYDTHADQLNTHGSLLFELAGAVRAFLDDLKAAKLAERVSVLAFSEFGRTVRENGSAGTDHGTAGPVLLAGPAVKGGLVGKTPSLTDLDPKHGDLRTGLDFRRVYAAVLEDWLGLPARPALGGSHERLPLFRA